MTAAFIEVINIKHDAEMVDHVVAVTDIMKSIMEVCVNAYEVHSIIPGTEAQLLNFITKCSSYWSYVDSRSPSYNNICT